MIRSIRTIAAGAALAYGVTAHAQEPIDMKIAVWIGDQHPVGQWIARWSEQLQKDLGGRVKVRRFPASQMGPAPQHYDLARTGQADLAYFSHGLTPGRFPLTELVNLPYMVGSGEIGTKVLNEPELRTKYLDAEHKGTKVLWFMTHQPGGLHTAKRPVRSLEDMKGLRIRFPSTPIRDLLRAMGATPVGVPPTEVSEQIQKGVIDGAMTDYGGAALALQLAGIVKYTTELYVYVTSFGFTMNEAYWAKLPPDIQKYILDTTSGREKEIGSLLDDLDPIGKKMLLDQGGRAEALPAAEDAKVRKIAAEVSQQLIKDLDAKKLPATEVVALMRTYSEKHAKTSRNFLK